MLRVDKAPAQPKDVVLEIENLRVIDDAGVERVKGINLNLRAGEVLNAGVAGNGQSELLEVLGGYQTASGKITVNGQEIDLTGKNQTVNPAAPAALPMFQKIAKAKV